jgi:hypothetical protein
MNDALITQRCYVCDAYFADKVKLGLHIALCYSDAVQRGVANLPQPAELLQDEKRYTEYMREKKSLDDDIADARRNKVSFATREDFAAMRTQLQPTQQRISTVVTASASPIAKPREVPVDAARGPRISGAGHRPPSDHLTTNGRAVAGVDEVPTANDLHSSPAYRFRRPESSQAAGGVVASPPSPNRVVVPQLSPVRQAPAMSGAGNVNPPRPQSRPTGVAQPTAQFPAVHGSPTRAENSNSASAQPRVASGVTMLRNELTQELANVRSFLAQEQQRAAEREAEFQYQHHVGQPPQSSSPMQQQQQHRTAQAPYHLTPGHVSSPVYVRPGSASASPAGSPNGVSSPGSDDAQRPCPSCGKLFGKRGLAAHSARCGMHATEDFTYSKDAEHPEQRKGHVITDKPTQVQPDPAEPVGSAAWQQFMMTYPRPVLDETPKNAAQRAAAAQNQAERRRFLEEMQRGGQPAAVEATVPCGRCHRPFAQSRVRQHEAVCVAKPIM